MPEPIDFEDGTWPPVPERKAPPFDIDRPCQVKRPEGAKPCMRPASYGNIYCGFHDEHTNGRMTHGRTSKYHGALPGRLLAAYEASLDDGRLLQMREEIALLDSRIVDLLARVDSGESGRLWARLAEVQREFSIARHQGKVDLMQEKLAELEALIVAGRRDAEGWREVQVALDLRRKLVESERRRITEQQQAVTAEQLAGFMSTLLELLTSEIEDRGTLARISRRLYQMVTIEAAPTQAVSSPRE
jgi:hypothetical protein